MMVYLSLGVRLSNQAYKGFYMVRKKATVGVTVTLARAGIRENELSLSH